MIRHQPPSRPRRIGLPLVFYVRPAVARVTLSLDDLRTLLLQTDGCYRARDGRTWDLESRRLCPGIYEVTARLHVD